MRARKMRELSVLLATVMVIGGAGQPVLAADATPMSGYEIKAADAGTMSQTQEGVTVTTPAAFLAALTSKESLIIVDGAITLGDSADDTGKMYPVEIPGGTVITAANGGSLNCRCPIQLLGDDVVFRDIKVVFESSDALGSVPHREIFLAGHSLTLDNVSTYLEGSGGSLGGLGGTETELLPTVYAGGFEGATIGTSASLTVLNSNSDTVFQAIYMGHEAESDNKAAYSGAATVQMDAAAAVRDGVYTDKNSSAKITMQGSGTAKTAVFYGNANTTLNVHQMSVLEAVVSNVGNVVLDAGAQLALKAVAESAGEGDAGSESAAAALCNVSVKNGAALDLCNVPEAVITGDFTGGAYDTSNNIDERGILVLDKEGNVTIQGKVTGTTKLHAGSAIIPGTIYAGQTYITAAKTSDLDFMLSDKDINNGFEITYENGGWTVLNDYEGLVIGSIEISSAPTAVDLNKIAETEDGTIPDETVFCTVFWKDADGNAYDTDTVEQEWLYANDYVIGIKSAYWESDSADVLDKTDWNNRISFLSSKEHPNQYFLQAAEGALTGDYTFLFCSAWYEGSLSTVADVKALKDKVMAEVKINFYDSATDPTPDPTPTPNPTPDPTPTPDDNDTPGESDTPGGSDTSGGTDTPGGSDTSGGSDTPDDSDTSGGTDTAVHTHTYTAQITQNPTCTKTGVRTYECSGCGDSYTEEIPALGHSCKTVITQKKAGADASKTTQCTVCKKVIKKSTIKAPKATSISGLMAQSKGVKVKWKKQSKQTTGYVIEYSTNSKFTKKTTKSVTVKGSKATSKTIKKLKAKKKYYVRVRTYRTVKADGKSYQVYSKWSSVKAVKTKK